MRSPWEDDARRVDVERRAVARAQRRGIGAAFDRAVPRDDHEPFIGAFLVTDGEEFVEVLAQFPESPRLVETVACTASRWVLERAVEDWLLASDAFRAGEDLLHMASESPSLVVGLPV